MGAPPMPPKPGTLPGHQVVGQLVTETDPPKGPPMPPKLDSPPMPTMPLMPAKEKVPVMIERKRSSGRTASRVLIVGGPNTFKTSSMFSWPHDDGTGHVCRLVNPDGIKHEPDEGMMFIVSYPGEKGWETIPEEHPGLRSWVFREDSLDPETRTPSGAVVREVERVTFDILAGVYGVPRVFFGDGLHKQYSYILDSVTGGCLFRGEDFPLQLYRKSHDMMNHYLTRVQTSSIPYVGFTCWDGKEADDPEAGLFKSPTHVFPRLPGQMAKDIMGEFSIIVYSVANYAQRQPGQMVPAHWQILPHGKVWGAAIKAPPYVIRKLPLTIPQSLPVLEETLRKAWAEE